MSCKMKTVASKQQGFFTSKEVENMILILEIKTFGLGSSIGDVPAA